MNRYSTVKNIITTLLIAVILLLVAFPPLSACADYIDGVFVGPAYDRYTPSDAFTAEEYEFIDSGKEVLVGFYEDTEPLAYIDDYGNYKGIYVEILEAIKIKTGINITLVPMTRDNNWLNVLANGKIDFYIGASAPVATLTATLKPTDTFIDYTSVLVTRNDCSFNQLEKPKIALTYGRTYWADFLPKELGEVEISYYHKAKDCLLAVQRGEVDGTLLNNIEYNYQSKNTRFASLITWENYRFVTQGGLVSKTDVDPIMFSTVNKAVGMLSEDYINDVISSNLNMAYNSTIGDILYSSRILIYVAAIALVALIIVVTVISRIRARQKAIIEKANEHERRQLKILAALSSDYDVVYYTDLDNDYCKLIRINEFFENFVIEGNSHSNCMSLYIENSVQPEYRDILSPYISTIEIIKRFARESDFSIRYKVINNINDASIFEMHFVDASESEYEHFMVFGIRCVDDIVREEHQQKQLLEDALEAANRANNAKSEFLSKMSHDIRTPMNAIIGMTAIASTHIDDKERIKDALTKITASSRHLLSLINDVLDMSKIESGKISLNEEAFNLSELINGVINIIQPQIAEHNHTLNVYIKDIKHEDVLGDTLRLQQVFLNILSNAVKYTNDGGEISLSVREIPASTRKASQYEFIFEDNGIGMSEEFLKHIFEPFERAEDLRISKIQGTGLGMPITQNIVHMMNGTIDVQSELGKGTRFVVNLFLKIQETAGVDTSELYGLPVMVVDNEEDVCTSVCEILNEIGMKGEGRTSGAEAIKAVEQALGTPDKFYAAIIDWKMPEMNGLETAKQIKKITNNELPVIVLTAYEWSAIEDDARSAGVDAFINKPVFKSGLIRIFKRLKNGEEILASTTDLDDIRESDYTGKRALLVEDNALNMEIAKEIFTMAGLVVDEAENGEIAVEAFNSSPENYYDIVFMDIQMPVMNGYQATVAIRSLSRNDAQSVPIVAMTANAFADDIRTAKNAGMNEHLAKPIDFEKLGEVLKKHLR